MLSFTLFVLFLSCLSFSPVPCSADYLWAPLSELDPFVGQWLDYDSLVYTFSWDVNEQSLNLSIPNTNTVSVYWIPENDDVYPNIVDQTLCQLSSYSPTLGGSPSLDQCVRLLWWYEIFGPNILDYPNNDPASGFTLVPSEVVRRQIRRVDALRKWNHKSKRAS